MRELLGIILLSVFAWVFYKKAAQETIKKYYFLALFLKIVAGIAVGLTYKFYYLNGDTWNYFNQAVEFNHNALSSWSSFIDLYLFSKYQLVEGFSYSTQPRAALMVKLVAVVNVLSNNNYWITSAYFSFFSFLGVWTFSSWVPKSFNYGKAAALVLFVWPSFVFWSSGILKESVAVGVIFWVIGTFFRIQESGKFRKIPVLVIALYFLFLIKYYFSIVLSVVLILYYITNYIKLNEKSLWKQLLIWCFVLITGFLIGGLLHPNLRMDSILAVIIGNSEAFIAKSNPMNAIHFFSISNDWMWLVINSPKALIAALFMPLSINGNSLMYSLSSIENWLLLILFLRGLYLLKLEQIKSNLNLLIASVSYIGMLAVFLALSTPNYGTLARYKVAYIPVVLVLVLLANRVKIFTGKEV